MTITEMLGIEIPVIQAPMAGSQNWELAVAVAQAGGLGSIPCGMLTPEQIVTEIESFRQHSGAAYNLNFFCHQMPEVSEQALLQWREALQPFYGEYGVHADPDFGGLRRPFSHQIADLIEPYAPPVISFHFGLPEPDLLQRVQRWGSRILSSATTLDEALWLQDQGVDAVIAQGLEAGGHRGIFLTDDLSTQRSTMELVSACAERLAVPVIAAGGISSAQTVQYMMQEGAAAVQLGTLFLLCDEAKTSPIHRTALQTDKGETALTNLFSGRPARGIRNRLMSELGDINPAAPTFPYATPALVELRKAAENQGTGDFSPLWSGTDRSGCRQVSARTLLQELWAEVVATQ